MKSFKIIFKPVALLVLGLGLMAGCQSSGGGGGSSTVYYGSGWGGPVYYHGDYDHDYDITVTPPPRPDRPDRPIDRPPSVSGPRPTPMPSIPSMSRPSFGGGGGGGRGGGGGGRR